MQKFLIEVPHEAETIACARAAKLLLESGSHFMTHADFGCLDGDHRAWIMVEGENKAEVQRILPPVLRPVARIVALNKFSLQEMDRLLQNHGG